MRITHAAAAFTLVCMAGFASPLFSAADENYGRISNRNSKDCTFTISDSVKTVGHAHILEEGSTGDGQKLGKIGEKMVLKGGTDYRVRFNSATVLGVGGLGLTFTLDNGDEATKINIKTAPMVGDVLIVSPKKNLKDSKITLDFKGYNNANGNFITIN